MMQNTQVSMEDVIALMQSDPLVAAKLISVAQARHIRDLEQQLAALRNGKQECEVPELKEVLDTEHKE
ncbi:hypothetical protein CMI37_28895 [Candidatus Pacearchaeota archaeon]|nr:hypothetical protein [Candidatus Pacearchaeota archaeon]|tara:strand:- start:3046 stop:3249 length:204 start_codon:yes stop_codon:yes gene_type:complete